MMNTAAFDRPRLILTAFLLSTLAVGACSNLGPPSSRMAATHPPTAGESRIVSEQDVESTRTPTSEATSTPTTTGTPVSSPTLEATSTPDPSSTPESSPPAELVEEVSHFQKKEAEFVEKGCLPDDGKIYLIESDVNGEDREFYAYRNGSLQLEFDKEFAENRYDYSWEDVGDKEHGEIMVLNEELDDAEERMEKIGYFIHAVNITERAIEMYGEQEAKDRGMYFLRREQTEYDPTWFERYTEFIDNLEGPLEYELEYYHIDTNGALEKRSLGIVDAKLPVKYKVLPPVMEREFARENEILGGDPGAPFGLSFREFTSGFYDFEVNKDGMLVILDSQYLLDGELMGLGEDSPGNISEVIAKAIDEPHGRSANVRYGPGDAPKIIINDSFFEELYGDYTEDKWVIGIFQWSTPEE